MNKIYKITRNRSTGQTVVVSELAKGNKKSLTGRLLALSVGAMALTSTSATFAAALIEVTQDNQIEANRQSGGVTINFANPDFTLIFQVAENSNNGAAIDTSGGLTLKVGDTNIPGGNLIFQNNKTTGDYGGAIYTTLGSLDLSTLNSILFSGNIADNSGYGQGGGFIRVLILILLL